eukprot:6209154-Pleurochrysis_carterae.AAC.2
MMLAAYWRAPNPSRMQAEKFGTSGPSKSPGRRASFTLYDVIVEFTFIHTHTYEVKGTSRYVPPAISMHITMVDETL